MHDGQAGFEHRALHQAPHTAVLALLTAHQHGGDAQHARQEQQAQGPEPQAGEFGGQHAPARHEARAAQPQGGAQCQECEPQRGRGIRHGAGHEHRAVHRVDAGLGHQAGVLQVALAPAAVALQLGQQVRRLLLVAADQVGHQPHVVAGAAHQRGFDEVVRHDAARHAAGALDGGQRAVLHEGFDADDRVVAPVVRLAELPELHAQREQATRHARSELLGAGVQRDVADGLRCGLDDAGGGVGFHQLDHRGQAVAAHHGVGVEHDHVAVVLAPAAAEVGHVAGLAVRAAGAQAVVHLDLRLVRALGQRGAQVFPGGALGGGGLGVVAVGQHEHVELLGVARGGDRFAGGAQAGEHGGHVLVADRHDDRGACLGVHRVVGHLFRREGVLVTAHGDIEAHERGHEAGHDPAREQAVQADLAVFEPDVVVVGLHAGEQRRRDHGAQQREQHEGEATLAGGAFPGLRGRGGLLGGGGVVGIAAGAQAHKHGGAQAVPETAPGARCHGTAVHRRCRDGVGVAFLAQRAAARDVGFGEDVEVGEVVRLHRFIHQRCLSRGVSPMAGRRLKTQSVAAPPTPESAVSEWPAARGREEENCF
ncbi:hypothetical protein D9M68_501870 [compost metagenome]